MPERAMRSSSGPRLRARSYSHLSATVTAKIMMASFGKKWYSKSIRGDAIHGSHCAKYAAYSSSNPRRRVSHASAPINGTESRPNHQLTGLGSAMISATQHADATCADCGRRKSLYQYAIG